MARATNLIKVWAALLVATVSAAIAVAMLTRGKESREMVRSAVAKVMWVGRATAFMVVVALAVASVGMLAIASPAKAETFTVNSTKDSATEKNPGDGKCETLMTLIDVPDQCTLRDAIVEANAFPGDDTINFRDGITGSIVLNPLLGQLSITSNITIDGPGVNAMTVKTDPVGSQHRLFDVGSGAVVEIEGLTISGGNPPDGEDGGGILNSGTLTLTNSTLSEIVPPKATNGTEVEASTTMAP